MRQLYQKNSANFPRLATDALFADYANSYAYRGVLDETFSFVSKTQLLRGDLWRRFVEQYRFDSDGPDEGWRGEYWGKMMRGACFVYSYTKDEALYAMLADTVRDMMSVADADGRISTYAPESEFRGWDLWSRKYVLLGMQYFLEICTDDTLACEIISSMCGQVDYLIARIGPKSEGKLPITAATSHWRGLNASSILEPVVRLYSLTSEKRFLDFAEYIVSAGATDVADIFELAYQDQLDPYRYPVTKAYEMISCFEGLLEYYRIVGEEKHREAIIRFANRVLESDFTVIGSAGCTHELFDHSTVRQANTTNGEIAQETCVTVTLMKFFYQLHILTGDSRYADAFERSLYNAYLGALNTELLIEPTVAERHPDWALEPLPFDSYSPLTAGTRGKAIGGRKLMSDMHYYGCCACIGSAGIGLVPKMQLLSAEKGLVMNLYVAGEASSYTPSGKKITLYTETEYPKSGEVSVKLALDAAESFVISLRNPEWSKKTSVSVNGEALKVTDGYVSIDRLWSDGDVITLSLDMATRAIYPIPYGSQMIMDHARVSNYMIGYFDQEDPIAKRHIALMRGPLMLAQENRLGYSVDTPVLPIVGEDGTVDAHISETEIAPYAHMLEVTVPLASGERMTMTDYASAGKLWNNESKMAVWILTP